MPRTTAAKRREREALELLQSKPDWESEAVTAKLQALLNAMEVPLIDAGARRALQKILHRWDRFDGGTGSERVTLLVRTVLESEGNQNALVEPIVSAVNSAMRPEWTDRGLAFIEAFDRLPLVQILETMRGLDLFADASLGKYLGMVLTNKLAKVFAPPPPPPKVKRASPPRGKRAVAKATEQA